MGDYYRLKGDPGRCLHDCSGEVDYRENEADCPCGAHWTLITKVNEWTGKTEGVRWVRGGPMTFPEEFPSREPF